MSAAACGVRRSWPHLPGLTGRLSAFPFLFDILAPYLIAQPMRHRTKRDHLIESVLFLPADRVTHHLRNELISGRNAGKADQRLGCIYRIQRFKEVFIDRRAVMLARL